MLHADFAALLPSQKARLIEAEAARLGRKARVITFTSGAERTHTYVAVELSSDAPHVRDECATWLVCPHSVGAIEARSGQRMGRVYFDNGRYGMTEAEAVENMFDRANR